MLLLLTPFVHQSLATSIILYRHKRFTLSVNACYVKVSMYDITVRGLASKLTDSCQVLPILILLKDTKDRLCYYLFTKLLSSLQWHQGWLWPQMVHSWNIRRSLVPDLTYICYGALSFYKVIFILFICFCNFIYLFFYSDFKHSLAFIFVSLSCW